MVIYNMFVLENKRHRYQLIINNLFKCFLLFYWPKKVSKNGLLGLRILNLPILPELYNVGDLSASAASFLHYYEFRCVCESPCC